MLSTLLRVEVLCGSQAVDLHDDFDLTSDPSEIRELGPSKQ